MGARKKGRGLAKVGMGSSFRNSFKASAIGCGMPEREVLLGPLRSWVYLRIFRSSRVKKAIARRAVRQVVREERVGGSMWG